MPRALLDENLPLPLTRALLGGTARHVTDEGWAGLANGALLRAAEDAGYDVLVTADQKLRHQQNLSGRRLAVVVLSTNHWPTLRREVAEVSRAIEAARPGEVVTVTIGRRPAFAN